MAPSIMPSKGPSAGTRVPRPPSSGSHRRTQTSPSSMDSYTSRASTIALDMLQLPTGERGGDLSVILALLCRIPRRSWCGASTEMMGGGRHWSQEPTNTLIITIRITLRLVIILIGQVRGQVQVLIPPSRRRRRRSRILKHPQHP
ncbi:hypothetical protein BYT27DRAFT_7250108 [Phlegmacium glaucopus]|nr:hypothetical protein BYT27DRAFT_7250108 [Phlegmacium glaucopus]